MKYLKTTGQFIAYWFMRYGHLLLPFSACVLSFVSTHILLDAVQNRSGDDIYHLMNEYAMAHGAKVGDSIFGPLGIEHGQPVLRFYQSLFYMFNVAVHLVTGWNLMFVHNLTLCLCFGLSPFSLYYFLRKLGLHRWTAGLSSYLSLVSVAAFGNSFEAFFQAGIVTQSMGGLFFPWFMGTFIGMLRGENSPVSAGTLFALAFLSHAIMAVYATFAGALYFLMSETGIRGNIRRFFIFAGVGVSLVAFWLFPFVSHNDSMRPVPDPVFRGSGVHWYTSVSSAELLAVAGEGYMLDDAQHKGNERNETEKFMDQINIIGSLSHRPPVFSLLTAFGILCALFRLRRISVRFLLGGFAFSLMLFAGPDDYRWTGYLPFMDKVQAFRCTYLYELFAFGLVGVGVETTVGAVWTLMRTRRRWWAKIPFFLVWAAGAGAVVGWGGYEIVKLGQTHLVIQDLDELNRDLDALQNVPDKGYPFKVEVRTGGRPKIRHAWFAMHGFMPYCTHWKGTGPEIIFKLCSLLGTPGQNGAFHAMSGIRWFSGWGPTISSVENLKDEDQLPALERIPSGTDRKGRDNSSRVTLDTGFTHFLRPMLGSPVPVVCNDAQWLWLATNWIGQYRNRLWSRNMPMIMRVPAGDLASSGLLDRAEAILYFDHDALDDERDTLAAFAADGGTIVSPVAIDGVTARVLGETESPWVGLPASINSAMPTGGTEREEMDPGLEVTRLRHLKSGQHTRQRFVYDIENVEPVVAVLPLERYPGWKAYRNGEEIPVFATGPDLVGVNLEPGVHRLNLVWEMPLRDRLCIVWTLLAVLFVLGVWIRRIVLRALNERFVAEL